MGVMGVTASSFTACGRWINKYNGLLSLHIVREEKVAYYTVLRKWTFYDAATH